MRKLVVPKKSAFIITDKTERRYFSGINLDEGIVLLTDEDLFYFIDARYFHAIKDSVLENGGTPIFYEGLDTVVNFVKEQGLEKLAVDFDTTTLTTFNTYKKAFGLEIVDCSVEIKNARAIKDSKELENIEKACEITQRAYYEVLKNIKEGITEKEVADMLCKFFIENGSEGYSFSPIVAFGEGSAIPHHETSERKLKKDEPILIDMGCFYNGYSSDYTRTAFFGTPSEKFLTAYELVLNANLKAEEKITNDYSAKSADAIARDYFRDNNVEEYFTHSLGHGIGMEIHEFPYLSKKSSDTLKENMVFSIEPGLYYTGEFGIRIEDTCVLIDGKVKRLFTDDKKLIIL